MITHKLSDYLDHIQDATQQACSYVEGLSKDEFLADKRTQQAVIMNLIIIGEAASKLLQNSGAFLDQHPEVPWRNLRGMRNRIAHGYFDINLNVVWDTVQTALPDLLDQLPAIAQAALEQATLAIDSNAQFKPVNPAMPYSGRIVLTTATHCVQSVGSSGYVIHAFSHPVTDKAVDIRYANGKPTAKAPSQDASLGR